LLVTKRNKEQILVFYVSHALTRVELNYRFIEKFAYALVLSSSKLSPYFEAHKVILLTDQPLKVVLQKLDVSERLLKWVGRALPIWYTI